MPVLNVTGAEDWVMRADIIRRANPNDFKTKEFLKALPAMAVAAINQVDDSGLEVEEVITVVGTFHPWSSNTPDMWVDLVCGTMPHAEGDTIPTYEQQEKRRDDIYALLDASIDEWWEGTDPRPQIDVEVRPLQGSGGSRDIKGELFARWGG
jgi:hypothetical protein